MKKFLVYLKEGKSIIVHATAFQVDSAYGVVTFFKEEKSKEENSEADSDIFVRYDQVVAIVPAPETKEEGGSWGTRSY